MSNPFIVHSRDSTRAEPSSSKKKSTMRPASSASASAAATSASTQPVSGSTATPPSASASSGVGSLTARPRTISTDKSIPWNPLTLEQQKQKNLKEKIVGTRPPPTANRSNPSSSSSDPNPSPSSPPLPSVIRTISTRLHSTGELRSQHQVSETDEGFLSVPTRSHPQPIPIVTSTTATFSIVDTIPFGSTLARREMEGKLAQKLATKEIDAHAIIERLNKPIETTGTTPSGDTPGIEEMMKALTTSGTFPKSQPKDLQQPLRPPSPITHVPDSSSLGPNHVTPSSPSSSSPSLSTLVLRSEHGLDLLDFEYILQKLLTLVQGSPISELFSKTLEDFFGRIFQHFVTIDSVKMERKEIEKEKEILKQATMEIERELRLMKQKNSQMELTIATQEGQISRRTTELTAAREKYYAHLLLIRDIVSQHGIHPDLLVSYMPGDVASSEARLAHSEKVRLEMFENYNKIVTVMDHRCNILLNAMKSTIFGLMQQFQKKLDRCNTKVRTIDVYLSKQRYKMRKQIYVYDLVVRGELTSEKMLEIQEKHVKDEELAELEREARRLQFEQEEKERRSQHGGTGGGGSESHRSTREEGNWRELSETHPQGYMMLCNLAARHAAQWERMERQARDGDCELMDEEDMAEHLETVFGDTKIGNSQQNTARSTASSNDWTHGAKQHDTAGGGGDHTSDSEHSNTTTPRPAGKKSKILPPSSSSSSASKQPSRRTSKSVGGSTSSSTSIGNASNRTKESGSSSRRDTSASSINGGGGSSVLSPSSSISSLNDDTTTTSSSSRRTTTTTTKTTPNSSKRTTTSTSASSQKHTPSVGGGGGSSRKPSLSIASSIHTSRDSSRPGGGIDTQVGVGSESPGSIDQSPPDSPNKWNEGGGNDVAIRSARKIASAIILGSESNGHNTNDTNTPSHGSSRNGTSPSAHSRQFGFDSSTMTLHPPPHHSNDRSDGSSSSHRSAGGGGSLLRPMGSSSSRSSEAGTPHIDDRSPRSARSNAASMGGVTSRSAREAKKAEFEKVSDELAQGSNAYTMLERKNREILDKIRALDDERKLLNSGPTSGITSVYGGGSTSGMASVDHTRRGSISGQSVMSMRTDLDSPSKRVGVGVGVGIGGVGPSSSIGDSSSIGVVDDLGSILDDEDPLLEEDDPVLETLRTKEERLQRIHHSTHIERQKRELERERRLVEKENQRLSQRLKQLEMKKLEVKQAMLELEEERSSNSRPTTPRPHEHQQQDSNLSHHLPPPILPPVVKTDLQAHENIFQKIIMRSVGLQVGIPFTYAQAYPNLQQAAGIMPMNEAQQQQPQQSHPHHNVELKEEANDESGGGGVVDSNRPSSGTNTFGYNHPSSLALQIQNLNIDPRELAAFLAHYRSNRRARSDEIIDGDGGEGEHSQLTYLEGGPDPSQSVHTRAYDFASAREVAAAFAASGVSNTAAGPPSSRRPPSSSSSSRPTSALTTISQTLSFTPSQRELLFKQELKRRKEIESRLSVFARLQARGATSEEATQHLRGVMKHERMREMERVLADLDLLKSHMQPTSAAASLQPHGSGSDRSSSNSPNRGAYTQHQQQPRSSRTSSRPSTARSHRGGNGGGGVTAHVTSSRVPDELVGGPVSDRRRPMSAIGSGSTHPHPPRPPIGPNSYPHVIPYAQQYNGVAAAIAAANNRPPAPVGGAMAPFLPSAASSSSSSNASVGHSTDRRSQLLATVMGDARMAVQQKQGRKGESYA